MSRRIVEDLVVTLLIVVLVAGLITVPYIIFFNLAYHIEHLGESTSLNNYLLIISYPVIFYTFATVLIAIFFRYGRKSSLCAAIRISIVYQGGVYSVIKVFETLFMAEAKFSISIFNNSVYYFAVFLVIVLLTTKKKCREELGTYLKSIFLG